MAVLKDLIVHGASRFLNGIQADTINAESIGATAGIFDKLIATSLDAKTATIDDLTAKNATITALLDVQGEMHTNSWSNANIATIDGSFYISPTSSSADGSNVDASDYRPIGTITYSNGNYTQLAITGTFNTSQLNLGNATNVPWPANSYVIVTGDVLVDNEWYPLGTIRGKLSSQLAANADSKTITLVPIGAVIISGEVGNTSLTDGNGLMPHTLEAIRIASNGLMSSLKMRKVKVSMTSYGGTNQSPIGIFMTAMGSNKKTFLDIYGGSNDTTTIPSGSGALALPTVRIGNLSGLPAVGSVTPQGWGIYTNNGFFTGAIVAKQGKIGSGANAWTIGNDSSGKAMIYTGTRGAADSAYISTGIGTEDIGGSGTLDTSVNGYWAFTAGENFGVTTKGNLYATGASISGAIDATSFQAKDPDGNVRAIVDENGLTVNDTLGNLVASFDEDGIEFSSSTKQRIGGDNNYIEFDPDTGAINIVGTNTNFVTTNQLNVVEDIIGVSNLIATEGNYEVTLDETIQAGKQYFELNENENIYEEVKLPAYKKTTDSVIDENKTYYIRTETQTEEGVVYIYTPVENPIVADIDTYYEERNNPNGEGWYELIGIKDTIRDYVSSHLVVTNTGLSLQTDNSDYRLDLTSTGMSIVRADGHSVAVYGTNAMIGSDADFHILVDATNKEIGFYQGDAKVAYMNASELYVVNNLSFGHFLFVERPNGHFTLKLVD